MIRSQRNAPSRRAAPTVAPASLVSGYDAQVRHADLLRRTGQIDAAVRAFHAITLKHPQRADAFSNLGGMLQAAGHPMLALQAITRAIALDPTNVPALINSAEIMKDFGEWQAARDTYDAAFAAQSASPTVRYARALHLLMLGEWREGWREHEHRLQVPDLPLDTLRLATPLWDGSPLNGQRILLHHEQGLGDELMFVRFLPAVAERGGRITLRCSAPLAPLFRTLPGVDTVVSGNDAIPSHDVRASLMSLPMLLGVDAPERLSGAPYLQPIGECPGEIRCAFVPHRTRVGLVWSGNPQHRNDARRSLPPRLLAPLLGAPNVDYVALQRHDGRTEFPAELRYGVRDLGGAMHSFNDTAHALMKLDVLVTVDTSVAHLAGALCVRTLLLVPFVPDWRWMVNRDDTPWYDSVQLLRQESLFEWAPVITRVRAAINAITPAT
jgi:hypothetical protein